MKTALKAESTGFPTEDRTAVLPGYREVWRKVCMEGVTASAILPQARPPGVEGADVP